MAFCSPRKSGRWPRGWKTKQVDSSASLALLSWRMPLSSGDCRTQLQGGLLPSWQTTVVPLLGGTTTVVSFAGGDGLLLLMHPESTGTATSKATINFMFDSSLICPSTIGASEHCP
jgi:hypothetical protein